MWVFRVRGWGPKSSVCPSKPREIKLFGGISRDYAGIFRLCPKSLRRKGLSSIFVPYTCVSRGQWEYPEVPECLSVSRPSLCVDVGWLGFGGCLLGDLQITSTSTERQERSQNLAAVLVIISGNSLVWKIVTSTGSYRCCAPGASAPTVVKHQSPSLPLSP